MRKQKLEGHGNHAEALSGINRCNDDELCELTTRAVIAEIQRAGKSTLAAIAQELEARGVRTPAGRDRWAPAQVSRLLAA
jgi:hypothetical protein